SPVAAVHRGRRTERRNETSSKDPAVGPLRGACRRGERSGGRAVSATGRAACRRVGLLSVATGLPAHELSQADARAFAADFFSGDFSDRREFAGLLESFSNARVGCRRLAVPAQWLLQPRTFAEKNTQYVE